MDEAVIVARADFSYMSKNLLEVDWKNLEARCFKVVFNVIIAQ
jgi:hypothetical protein